MCFSAISREFGLMIICAAKYQDCHLHTADILLLPYFHDSCYPTLVYWHPTVDGRVLRDASCEPRFAVAVSFTHSQGSPQIVTRVLLNKNTYTDSVNQTPYFSGIITASLIWVVYAWISRLLQRKQPGLRTLGTVLTMILEAESHAFSHLSFAIIVGLCAYNFFRAITLDPGTCPKPASDDELKQIIEDLASEGRLNGQTFCIQCMARKPLRSKHCRICDKCIARSDQCVLSSF